MPPSSLPKRKNRRLSHNFPQQKLVQVYSSRRVNYIFTSPSSKRLVRKYSKPRSTSVPLLADRHQESKPKDGSDKAESTGFINKSKSGHPNFNAEMTAIPIPIPDTGVSTTRDKDFRYSQIQPTSTFSQVSTATPGITLIPMLTLKSVHSSTIAPGHTTQEQAMSISIVSTPSPDPSYNAADALSQNQESHVRKFPMSMIVFLAIGGGLVFIGAFIALKLCTRPTRRPRPKPSLPILDDPFADDYGKMDSPIFGGNERPSSRPEINSNQWTWVNYTQPTTHAIQGPQTATDGTTVNGKVGGYGAVAHSPRLESSSAYPFVGYAHSRSAPTVLPTDQPPPETRRQSAIARTANRISAASMSMYMESSLGSPGNIGLAISGVRNSTTFTADGHPIIKRTKSKSLRRSRGNSIIERKRDSANCFGLAYDGTDVSSPGSFGCAQSMATPNLMAPSEGRTRIKSSYFAAGSYPRLSTLPSSYSIATATKVNLSKRHMGQETTLAHQKSESRRERDTKALTHALGLTSPPTDYSPSPQLTIYPDDSLSVYDAKRFKRLSTKMQFNGTGKQATERMPVDNLAGGQIPLDFEVGRMSISLPNLESEDRTRGQEDMMVRQDFAESKKSTSRLRQDDKPPRVPSPPALPSLTQMGLEHLNPEAYANYRSPTYSIYGLYDSDRKSVFVSK